MYTRAALTSCARRPSASVTGTTTVTTSLTTVFEDGACNALANGVLVEVKGPRTGNTISATVVEQK